jgi:hypothetical protein
MAVPSITPHRHAEVPRQVGAGRRAVEQAHDTFDQDQVGFARGFPQQRRLLLADHPHVQLIHRRTAGALEDHRVEKVRAAFEHAHLAPLVAVQTGQRGGDGGLALTGGRRGDQHRRAMTLFIDSQLDAFLRLDTGLEGVLDHAHFGDGVGQLDHLRLGATTGDHHVLHRRASLQVAEHLIQIEVAVLEGDVQLIQHHQADGWIAQRGTLPTRLRRRRCRAGDPGFPR